MDSDTCRYSAPLRRVSRTRVFWRRLIREEERCREPKRCDHQYHGNIYRQVKADTSRKDEVMVGVEEVAAKAPVNALGAALAHKIQAFCLVR
jgi:hypothetical protein